MSKTYHLTVVIVMGLAWLPAVSQEATKSKVYPLQRPTAVNIQGMLWVATGPPGPKGAEISPQPRPEALSFGLAFSGAGQF